MSRGEGAATGLHPRRLFYGWYIVGAGTLNSALLLGLVFYGFGIFMEFLIGELGWAPAAVAFGFTLQRMEAGLFAPVVGYLIDRFGPRPVALVGVAVNGAAFLLFAGVQSLLQFYAASLLIALGQSMATVAPFTTSIVYWFQRLRARAVSFMMAGTGIGTIGVYPLVALIESIGWRGALVVVGLLIWVVGGATVMTLRTRPEEWGSAPDGDLPDDRTTAPMGPEDQLQRTGGVETREALRSPAFWFLLTSALVFGFANLGWVVLQFPALQAKGLSAGLASAAVALYGVASIAIRIAVGWFGDRLGRQRMLLGSFALQSLGLAVFAAADRFSHLLPYYFLYALGHAAYIIAYQTIVADYFGTRRFATIRGWIGMISSIGGAAGPPFGAWIYEVTGSYDLAFAVFAAVVLVGVPAMWLADRYRPVQEPAQWSGARG